MKKEARKWVKSEIDKYGFGLAYHYWAYDIAWNNPLHKWDKACMRAFDYFAKKVRKKNYGNY